MAQPLCPICGADLLQDEKQWHCPNGHSFDVARQGYVNLLPVTQKHSLHPGDTKEMVAARKEFLDAGYYLPIAHTLREILCKENPKAVLDVGCGEGYYLTQALPKDSEGWGVDISKDAVRYASARNKNASWLVATGSHLPFGEESFDCVLSMFALTEEGEFSRVLRKGGLMVIVTARRDHLLGLKEIIYPQLLLKEENLAPQYEDFTLEREIPVDFSFTLTSSAMVQNLLAMTPHFWRISKDGALRTAETQSLTDTARVLFRLYRKKGDSLC
ncbi:MAG: methyltransferase domain-containing protein [Oscillospiraceae bacterium]|nr:methyltransferase domain-containing protein [Oscillospiraceae bacterium]